jgi:hypothetical protein
MAVEPYEEYKLLAEDTARLSDRRHNTNSLYLTANSVLLGASAILLQQSGLKDVFSLSLVLLVAVAGAFICASWLRLIAGYRTEAKRRFSLLQDIEDRADFEWPVKIYAQGSNQGRGFSGLEAFIPTMFIVTYILFVAVSIAFKFTDLSTFLK